MLRQTQAQVERQQCQEHQEKTLAQQRQMRATLQLFAWGCGRSPLLLPLLLSCASPNQQRCLHRRQQPQQQPQAERRRFPC